MINYTPKSYTGKAIFDVNELSSEYLQWLKELLDNDHWCGYLQPTIHLFTFLEIVEHLEEIPNVYKNSDILRRKNDENTI